MRRDTKVTILGATGQLRRITHPCGCVGDYVAPPAPSQCVNIRRCPLDLQIEAVADHLETLSPENRSMYAVAKVRGLLTRHGEERWKHASGILYPDK